MCRIFVCQRTTLPLGALVSTGGVSRRILPKPPNHSDFSVRPGSKKRESHGR
jgi:hypothetical protein